LPNRRDPWQELAIIIERSLMAANSILVSPERAKGRHPAFFNTINLLSDIIREQPVLASSHHTL
jgi:hypothetical protein